MRLQCAFSVFRRDAATSPRSNVFFFVLALPVMMTLLFQLVFGSLFEPKPRLGVVDSGRSEITTAVRAMDGIDVSLISDTGQLMRMLERHDLDAGLILTAGFDEAVVSGERPHLGFFVSGRSLASDRIILAVTTIDLVRTVEGNRAPIEVAVTTLGDADQLPLTQRFIPILVLYALLIAGVFSTAFNLVQEREHGTLTAMLVTPVGMTDVLAAKGFFGFLLAIVVAFITLAMNGVLGADHIAMAVTLLIAAFMSVEFGLVFATSAKDIRTLYTLVKSLNILLFAPVFFYLFPGWPRWIARIFPTYWFFDPMFEISLKNAALREVWSDLAVALAICIALVPLVRVLGRRMERALATS